MTAPLLDDETFHSLIAAYLEAREAGRDADAEQLLADHPDRAEDVRRFLSDQEQLADLAAPFRAIHGLAEADTASSEQTLPHSGSSKVPGLGSFGDYELLEEIARGGMGVVFRARHRRLNRLVALKMILTGPWSTPADLQRFHTEVRSTADLDHPNIVPVYEDGCYQGQHFYAMKLIEGVSLAQLLDANPGGLRPRDAARLMVTVARAVQHAHQRGILHRDLKPANILLQEARGKRQEASEEETESTSSSSPLPLASCPVPLFPYVTDFGLAKRVPRPGELSAHPEEATLDGTIVGTPSYMAPEQAAGRSKGLSTAADVWGLGAILYELLTGRVPFRSDSVFDTLVKIQTEEPPRPRSLNPALDRDLETVALKCLRKEPGQRYRSAAQLADDLERWLEGRPIHARRASNTERLWRWCLRNPAVAGLAFTVIALLVAVAVPSALVARDLEKQLREEAGQSNLYAARGVASTVLWHLNDLSQPLIHSSQSEELRRLLKARDADGLMRFCDAQRRDPPRQARLPDGGNAFQNWYILDQEGRMLAECPPVTTPALRPFAYRNYFQGAMQHARAGRRHLAAVHLSRVYRGTDDALSKLGLSIPIYDGDGEAPAVLGVLVATLTTASTLGTLELNDGKRTVVLAGRAESGEAGGEYLIMLHPGYQSGTRAVPVDSPEIRAVHRPHPGEEFTLPQSVSNDRGIDLDYRDPVGGEYAGRWLAGFASVGNTEYVVIVQQRHETALEPGASLTRHLLLWGGITLLLGTAFTVALQMLARRRA